MRRRPPVAHSLGGAQATAATWSLRMARVAHEERLGNERRIVILDPHRAVRHGAAEFRVWTNWTLRQSVVLSAFHHHLPVGVAAFKATWQPLVESGVMSTFFVMQQKRNDGEHPGVPDFFQEDSPQALRQKVSWLEESVPIDNSFFASLVGKTEREFDAWLWNYKADADVDEAIRDLWQTVVHLLSFVNFDRGRLRELFESTVPLVDREMLVVPPWSGTSLRQYLEQGGARATADVDKWVTGLRFGDLYR
jgi:hypothetical protein